MSALKISNPETLAALTMNAFNARFHSAINTSPLKCHFSPFCAAQVAELDRLKRRAREIGAINLQLKKKPHDVLKINQQVKIRKKMNVFRKESLFQPAYSNSVHVITHIDKNQYPPLYTVSGSKHRYYDFQLLALSDSFPNDHLMPQPKHKILIQDVTATPSTSTSRSGKERQNTTLTDVKYTVLRDGEIAFLTRPDLELYRKLFGNQILAYNPVFNKPEYQKYIV